MTITTIRTGLTLQRERAHDLWLEAMPLFEAHLDEMPHVAHEPLNLDVEGYLQAEENGVLRCYTVRLDERLIGYGIFFVHPHLWHRGRRDGSQHALYLMPEYRRGLIGVRLIRFIEKSLRQEGAKVCRQHAHKGRREGTLFKRLDYHLVHEEYEKYL